MAYYIEYQGAKRTPAEWGITLGKLSLRNQEADQLVLESTASRISAPLFAFDQKLVLWRDTTRIFQGKVAQPSARANGRGEGTSYLIKGPWWDLEGVTYQQGRLIWGTIDAPSSDATTSLTSRVMLGMGADLYTPWDSGAQITFALIYAIGTYSLDLAIGDIDVHIRPPYQEGRDLTIADVIRRMLGWSPDAVVWFDYSPEVPTINVKLRADLDVVSLDLDAGDKAAEFSAMARHDLVPSGVFFFFEKPITIDYGNGDLRQKVSITSQSAGAGKSLPRHVVKTFQLAGANFGEDVGEPEPLFLASLYYDSVKTLHYEGELLLLEQEVTGLLALGQVLNITNSGDTAHATMNALLQEVEYDLAAGETYVRFGPPTQLGPAELFELMQSSFALTRDNGNPPTGPQPLPPQPPLPPPLPPPLQPPLPPDGLDLRQTADIELCDGSCIKVLVAGSC